MKASMKPTSDHDIIELFFQRNENAITETDRKYRAYLLTVAKGFVNDKEDAEECLNDTCHDTWNKIPPARPENLKAFLAVIMRRTAIDRLKHETRKKRISAGLAESLSELESVLVSDSDQHTALEAHELDRAFNLFLKNLTERRRYLFISRYYMALSAREIADKLECSVSTVTKELTKIREELKKYLIKEGYSL